MNKFNREELESILDAFNYIEDSGAWRHAEGWNEPLKKKIEAMLGDSICDHEWVALFLIHEEKFTVIGGTRYKCLRCSKYFPLDWSKEDE